MNSPSRRVVDDQPPASHRRAASPCSAGLGPNRPSGGRRCAVDRRRPRPRSTRSWLNLALNAQRCNARRRHAHALRSTGSRRLRLDPRHSAIAAGRYCRITVSDTGDGIDGEHAGAHLRAVLHDQGRRYGAPASASRPSTESSVNPEATSSSPPNPLFGTTFEVILPAAPSKTPSDPALQAPPSAALTRSGPARGRSIRAARHRAGSADDLELV